MPGLDDINSNDFPSGCVLKIGEVSSIDPASCKARVVFDDEDSMTTDLLPVLQRNTLNNHDYWMPDVGEDVLCVFMGESAETGFIVGSWYAGEITPPDSTENIRSLTFSDEAKFTYNRSSHTLTITIGSTTITADQNNVSVSTSQTVDVEGGSTVNVKGGNTVNVEGGSTVNINGGSSVNITAPSVTLTMGSTTMRLNGSQATITSQNITFEGNATVTGNMEVEGNIHATGTITSG